MATEGLSKNGVTSRVVRRLFGRASFAASGAALAVVLSDSWLAAAFAALWWCAVLAVARCDIEAFIIPDAASAAIGILGLLYVSTHSLLAGEAASNIAAAALNGAAAFALFWGVARGYRAWRGHEGLGFGDVKLAGASAVWLAPREAATALEIAALGACALLLRRARDTPPHDVAVPFGAFLAPAAWLVFVLRPALRSLFDGGG